MFIFTGMDNSGKTTAAEKMAQENDLTLVKSIGPQATKSEKDLWFMDQLIRDRNFPDSVVYDRFLPFEEMVYGTILRGHSDYTLEDKLVCDLKDQKPVIVYTRPPSDTIFNFGEREQMDGVISQSQNLLRAWDDLMWKLLAKGWNVILHDYTETLED